MFPAFNYMLLDAARMGSTIDEAILRNARCESLYRGESEAAMSSVAPYLFAVRNEPAFVDWRLKAGWGASWGVMLQASVSFPELHRHFRKFLLLKTEGGKELYFRFYDPRVLRMFLPTCDAEQLREFFGPVQYLIAEDAEPGFALHFSQESGQLQIGRISVKAFLEQLPEPGPAVLVPVEAGPQNDIPLAEAVKQPA